MIASRMAISAPVMVMPVFSVRLKISNSKSSLATWLVIPSEPQPRSSYDIRRLDGALGGVEILACYSNMGSSLILQRAPRCSSEGGDAAPSQDPHDIRTRKNPGYGFHFQYATILRALKTMAGKTMAGVGVFETGRRHRDSRGPGYEMLRWKPSWVV